MNAIVYNFNPINFAIKFPIHINKKYKSTVKLFVLLY